MACGTVVVPCPGSRAGAARRQRTLDAGRGAHTLRLAGRRLLQRPAPEPVRRRGRHSDGLTYRSISGPFRVGVGVIVGLGERVIPGSSLCAADRAIPARTTGMSRT